MAKKKDQRCPHGRFFMEVCQCFGCKLDHFRNNPDQLVKAGEFVEIIDWLFLEIDYVRSEIPREYDPQCE